jgi:hypothetical protein
MAEEPRVTEVKFLPEVTQQVSNTMQFKLRKFGSGTLTLCSNILGQINIFTQIYIKF